MPFSPTDQFRDVVRRIIYGPGKTFDPRRVADELGVTYRVLMHWVGDDPTRRFPAELVPKFCTIVRDFGPLDYVEQQLGRLAFELPAAELVSNRDVLDAHKLMKETTEAIGSLLKAVEDGFIEEREARHTIAELDDVIRQRLRVRHWMEQQLKRKVPDRAQTVSHVFARLPCPNCKRVPGEDESDPFRVLELPWENPLRLSWDVHAEHHETLRLYSALQLLREKGLHVLDLGAGDVRIATQMSRLDRVARVVCYDMDEPFLRAGLEQFARSGALGIDASPPRVGGSRRT